MENPLVGVANVGYWADPLLLPRIARGVLSPVDIPGIKVCKYYHSALSPAGAGDITCNLPIDILSGQSF